MKINRIRNPATIVPGAQWVNGLDTIGLLSPALPPEPTPEPVKLLELPPLNTEEEAKWELAIEIANDVVAELSGEPDFDPATLLLAVRGVIDTSNHFTVGDLVAAYRRRKAQQ